MKKYVKAVVIALFTIITIGTYYIQTSFASSNYPQFTLKTISGDESEVNDISVHSNYQIKQDGKVWLEETAEISKTGTTYMRDKSYYGEMLKGYSVNKDYDYLMKNYRSFMRGNEGDPVTFAENDHYLVNVRIDYNYVSGYSNSEFTVNTYNKKTKKKASFTLPIPDYTKYDWINIQDVRLANGKIFVATTNEMSELDKDGNYVETNYEGHIYTIDLQNNKMLKEEILLEKAFKEGHVYGLDRSILETSPYMVLVFDKFNATETDEHVEDEMEVPIQQIMIIYNIETDETEVLDMQKVVKTSSVSYESRKGNTVFISTQNDEKLTVYGYDLESKKVASKQTFVLPKSMMESKYVIDGNRTFIIDNQKKGNTSFGTITAYDTKTGKLLYEGSIEIKGNKGLRSNEEMEFYNINKH